MRLKNYQHFKIIHFILVFQLLCNVYFFIYSFGLQNSLKGHVHVAEDIFLTPETKKQVSECYEKYPHECNFMLDKNGVVVLRKPRMVVTKNVR